MRRVVFRDRGLDALWTRAPLVLLRYPGLFASLAIGALLVSLAAAAYPLLVSASAARLVDAEVAAPLTTRYGAGVAYTSTEVSLSRPAPSGGRPGLLYERRGALFRRLASESPYLGGTISGFLGPMVSIAPAGRPDHARPARLFAGTDAAGHVQILSGKEGSGAWLPDLIAGPLRVGPGDRITVGSGSRAVDLPVDGVYRSLYSLPQSGYWLPWSGDIYPTCAGLGQAATTRPRGCPPPPQFVLVDRDRWLEMSAALDVRTASFGWQAPLTPGTALSLDDAADLSRFAGRFQAAISDEHTYLGRTFDCCHARALHLGRRQETRFGTEIHRVVSEVARRVAAVEGPGQVLRAAGLAVALAVVAGGSVFGLAARRTEGRLLFARGAGPAASGARAALESVLPCVLGGGVGLALAFLLARVLGPDGPLAASAGRAALAGSALAALASIVTVGLVGAAGSLARHEHHRTRLGTLARAPWELLLLLLAFYCWRRLPQGAAGLDPFEVRRPSPYLLLFPVSFIGGFALLGARLFREGARWARERSGRSAPWAYLAVHRLAGAPGLTLLLVGAAGLCLGVSVQSQAMVRSLEDTVHAKARVFVGSDVQAWVDPTTPIPEDLPLPVTKVARRPEAGTASPGDRPFDLLAVDPATLARAAYWNEAFSDLPLKRVLGRIAERGGTRLPVVVAGGGLPGVSSLQMSGSAVSVEVVARTEAFPGMLSRRPLVVVGAEALGRATAGMPSPLEGSNARTELWLRGDPHRAVVALSGLRAPPYLTVTAEEVEDIPYIAAVIGTFVIMQVLGLATAALAVAAMLVYLEARQRSQVVAYGLSVRMGMSPAAHRRALLAELGSMLGSAWLVGVALAAGTALVMVPRLDPLPRVPPDPLTVAPVALAGVVLLGVGAASWLGARLAARRAAATHLGEVMRVAE